MNGILIIDKPAGITSHDVVSRVRRILRTKRIGHTGTLDPFATGVMVVLVGQATRLAQFLDKDEKEYEATLRFGFETDTGDLTGVLSAECGMRSEEIDDLLRVTDWDSVLSTFRGEVRQVPPMYSAKKIDGKKLYELARKGETVDREAVVVTIHELELISPEGSAAGDTLYDGLSRRVRVVCGAGTYIRTLAEDIGRVIGPGAHLTQLRRTRAGKFGIEQSLTLDQLDEMDQPQSAIIPMEVAVSHLPSIELNDERVAKTRNGLATRVSGAGFKDGEAVRMVMGDGSLVAIGFYNEAENIVQPKVVLV